MRILRFYRESYVRPKVRVAASRLISSAAVWWLLQSAAPAQAQTPPARPDSLRTYRLSEIVIGDDRDEAHPLESVQRIGLSALAREETASASGLVRLIPSAHLQTNSRGESLIYIRNAGERQVGVFLDGALIIVPWDYRIDLSLLPTGMLGGMTVSRGIPSVVYGTNVIGGAVNLQSRALSGPGSYAEFGANAGSRNSRRFSGTYLVRSAGWSAVASGSYYATDGQALPDNANLSFSQADESLRTNTDRRIGNLFVRVGRHFSERTEVGMSLTHIRSEKGVAPEGHIDPEVDRVRFWRYPDWRNTMLIANAVTRDGSGAEARAAFWMGRFLQDIAQYGDVSYTGRTDLQEDRDATVGFRLTGRRPAGPGDLRAAVNWVGSKHRQTDTSFLAGGAVDASSDAAYRQMLFSTGAEYELPFGDGFRGLAGLSLDGQATPRTGDKPARDPDFALGATAGLEKQMGFGRLRWSAGRKVRFPTMRELFGEALRRFALNPDLKPETALQSELAVEFQHSRYAGEVIAFVRRTYDTIDQEVVEVEGERKRRRINLEGSRVWGLEAGAAVRLNRVISLDGHATWMDPRATEGGKTRLLNEKPRLLSTVTIRAGNVYGGSLDVSWIQTGSARALALDNTQVRLAPSAVFNVRAALGVYLERQGVYVLFSGIVHNLTDEAAFSQLGLPGPGREVQVGIEVSF